MPDTAQTKRGEPGKVEVQAQVDSQRAQQNGATKDRASPEPVPLDLRCDGPMQVAFPKPHLPVKEGPPAPPGPTLVHFERNVVVRRGRLTEQPDQLDSDNLDLTLVPAEKTAPGPGKALPTGSQAVTVAVPSASSGQAPAAEDAASSGSGEQKGMLGDLVLQALESHGPRGLAPVASEGRQDFLQRAAAQDRRARGSEPYLLAQRPDSKGRYREI